MKLKLTFLLALTFLFLFSGSVFGGNWEDGVHAYLKQDYKTAHRLWLPLAEQGDAKAQYNLGLMYEKGKGISKDFVEAYKWFSISGETGNGRMYIEKLGKRKMTTAQIAEAQKLAQEWVEKHQQK